VAEKAAFADIDDGNGRHDSAHGLFIATRRSKPLAAPRRNKLKKQIQKINSTALFRLRQIVESPMMRDEVGRPIFPTDQPRLISSSAAKPRHAPKGHDSTRAGSKE
jgi:hypothetical protein